MTASPPAPPRAPGEHRPTGDELRWLLGHVRPYRGLLGILLGLFVVGAALGLAYPMVLRFLIDRVFTAHEGDRLLPALGVLLGLSIAQVLVSQVSSYRYTRLAGRIVLDLRIRLFRHLERVPLDFYARRRAGDIASRIGGDIAEVQQAATGTVMAIATASLTLVATTAVLLYLDPVLFGWSLVLVPCSMVVAWRFARPVREAARSIREENANLGSTLFDSLLGQHFIRSHGLETPAARRFWVDGRRIFDAVLHMTRLNCWSGGLTGVVGTASSLVVLGVGGSRVLDGSITLGDLMAFQMYVAGLHGPLQGLIQLHLRLQRARVSVVRIREILDEPAVPRGGGSSAGEIRGELTFEHVSFAYPGGPPILEDVSFTVRPGERVAVIGPSGIGKSTLLDLAIGLRSPTSGRVLLDGHDLLDYRPAALRSRVGVVSQDVFLFHASIRENLLLVRPGANEEELVEALDQVELGDWIGELPEGLDTSVGERALRLSGGQRQRLALARAILRRPKLLVLDEATSALDEITDAQIREALAPILRDAASLVASHRPSFVADADRAILLHQGRIHAEGPPAEVMALVQPARPRPRGERA